MPFRVGETGLRRRKIRRQIRPYLVTRKENVRTHLRRMPAGGGEPLVLNRRELLLDRPKASSSFLLDPPPISIAPSVFAANPVRELLLDLLPSPLRDLSCDEEEDWSRVWDLSREEEEDEPDAAPKVIARTRVDAIPVRVLSSGERVSECVPRSERVSRRTWRDGRGRRRGAVHALLGGSSSESARATFHADSSVRTWWVQVRSKSGSETGCDEECRVERDERSVPPLSTLRVRGCAGWYSCSIVLLSLAQTVRRVSRRSVSTRCAA